MDSASRCKDDVAVLVIRRKSLVGGRSDPSDRGILGDLPPQPYQQGFYADAAVGTGATGLLCVLVSPVLEVATGADRLSSAAIASDIGAVQK